MVDGRDTPRAAAESDVEELRRRVRDLEAALVERDRRFRDFTDKLPGVAYQFFARRDGSLGFNFVSGRAAALFGLEARIDGLYERFTAHLDERDRERFVASVRDAVAAGAPWDFTGRYVKPSGEIMWFRGMATSVVHPHETLYNGILLDVSARKAAEEELQRHHDRLEELVAERTRELGRTTEEQARLIAILESTSDMVSTARLDSRITYMNAAGRGMLGWRDLDDRPRSISAAHPGWAREIVTEIGMPAAAAKGIWRGDSAVLGPGGEEIPVSQVIMAHRDASGELRYWSTIVRDMTERLRTEKQLRRARGLVRNVIDSMPSVIVAVDRDGIVTQWNVEASRATGLSAEEAEGRPVESVLPLLPVETEKVLSAVLDARPLVDLKVPRSTAEGIRYEDVTVYPIVAEGRQGAVIRVDDATERVQLEEILIQSEKMLSVGGLAAGMAHEINNPLAGILQNAAVISERLSQEIPANDRAAEKAGTTMPSILDFMRVGRIFVMVVTIKSSGLRAARIVRNMLSFARKSDAAVSSHRIDDLLERAIELAQSDYDLEKRYDFRGIEIVREIEPHLPAVPCDAAKIQQVFLNILKNGAEAMSEAARPGGQTSRFKIRGLVDREWIRVEIEDNGPGMDEATRRRIFEPFFTTKPAGVGTGLGLSVSYFIVVENHGGRLTVEPASSGGARFVIRLPLAR